MDNTLIIFEVFLIFSQSAVSFEKSPSQMEIDEEHLFWGTARAVLFVQESVWKTLNN